MYRYSDYEAIISLSPEQRVQERSNDILYDKICGILIAFAYKYELRFKHIDILTIKDAEKEIRSLIDDNKINETLTIQVEEKEYQRLQELDKERLIKEFKKKYSNNPYGIIYSKLEETKEDKDYSTISLLIIIIILLAYIIWKQ